MTITQLEYTVAVANYKSFVAAAEKCFVTQPTLSMQIQKLEDELGIRLFDRSKHPIAVTDMGKEIVEQARVVIAQSEKIMELVNKQIGTLSGIFRFAVIPTVAPYILPGIMEQYSKSYPDISLKVTEMETAAIISALRNNEIDAALVSTPLEENGIREHPLFYEPLVAYFAPGEPALEKRTILPEDVAMERLWMLSEGNCMRNQVLDLCSDQVEKLQSHRQHRYESSNVETLRRLVDSNGGLTVLPELATADFDEDRMERIRYFEGDEPVREIGLVTISHFVKHAMLQSLKAEIIKLVPKKMWVEKENRKILRIQSAKLH